MAIPEIAILVSTFRRPDHLRRCLLSISQQRDVLDRIEVVVTDDGSEDDTERTVEQFAANVSFPVNFVTHAHQGFRLSKCRNEGVRCSQAPYILFTDGDCLLPPDHVGKHLEARRRGVAIAGDCIRFPRDVSEHIDNKEIISGEFVDMAPRSERWRLWQRGIRGLVYGSLRIPMRPRFTGNNIALFRRDLININGFDENYVGWGFEDVDLQRRLAWAGIRFRTILHRTRVYHLWHAPAPTFARNGLGTANRDYFLHARSNRNQRCRIGLAQTQLENHGHRRWTAYGNEHATPTV